MKDEIQGTAPDDGADAELEAAFAAEENELTDAQKDKIAEASKGMTDREIELQRRLSQRGRKLAGLEDRFGKLEEEFGKLKTPPKPDVAAEPDDDDAEQERIKELFYENPIEANRQLKAYDEKKASSDIKKYEGGYIAELAKFQAKELEQAGPDEGKAMYEEIYKEMFDNFNVRRGDNAAVDAEINWANARAAVFSRMAAEGRKPKYKGAGDRTDAPAGAAGVGSASSAPSQEAPKLEGKLAAYAKHLERQGKSPEQIAEMLKD